MVRILVLAVTFVLLSGCTGYIDEPITDEDAMRTTARKNAIPVHIVPGLVGWSQSGTLVTQSPGAGVTLQAIFHEPGNYTVQFGISSVPPAGLANLIRPEAEITWKVQGNQVTRVINVGDGTSITGQAEAVSVRLFDSSDASMGGTAGIPYVGSIQVTKGIRAQAANQAPMFVPTNIENPVGTSVVTTGSFIIANGTAARIPIPPGSVQMLVGISGSMFSPGNVIITEQNSLSSQLEFTPDFSPVWVPVVPLATRVNMLNSSGAAIRASCIFGIDG